MDEKIRQHIIKWAEIESEDFFKDDKAFHDLLAWEAKQIHSESRSEHRWWQDVFIVVEIDGMLIGFMSATTTGDDSAYDKGWEFDPSTVTEVKRAQFVGYTYLPVDKEGIIEEPLFEWHCEPCGETFYVTSEYKSKPCCTNCGWSKPVKRVYV